MKVHALCPVEYRGRSYQKGDLITMDPVNAQRWIDRRYVEPAETPQAPALPDALKGLAVEQLKAYALEHQIPLGDATKKADIQAAIAAHVAEAETE